MCSDNAEGLIKYRGEIRGSKNSSLSSEAVTLYNLNRCTSHYRAQQQQLKGKACSCVRQGINQLMLGSFNEISSFFILFYFKCQRVFRISQLICVSYIYVAKEAADDASF